MNYLGSDGVRVELVESMRIKYADIDIDKEIDMWLGVVPT